MMVPKVSEAMRRRLVTMVTLVPLSCGPFSSERDPLRYASAPLHGDFPYSVEERRSISRNHRVLAEIAAVLTEKEGGPTTLARLEDCDGSPRADDANICRCS